MNQGRIWCVVSPNVGLPLLLGSVAVTSLIVHACVMSHTPWMSSYWSGSWRNRTSAIESTAPPVASVTPQGQPAFAVTVTPVPAGPGKTETAFVVTVTPNPGVQDPVPRAPSPLAMATPTAK
jgi:light-harvesting protein B-800-850 alpha chain